jgi:hypothetical protein
VVGGFQTIPFEFARREWTREDRVRLSVRLGPCNPDGWVFNSDYKIESLSPHVSMGEPLF